MEDLCTNCLDLRHHSNLPCEKKEPVLATQNVTSEEEPPEIVCVTCLLTGHQNGKECHLPKDECENCGHSHNWMVSCMEVRICLKFGGDPLSRARPKINEETPMEDICANCHELRHHSCIPCKDKKKKEVVKSQETLNTPDHPPQLTVPMPTRKTVSEETVTPVVEKNGLQESPKLSYRDALKKGSVQSQDTSKMSDYPPQFVTLMPRGKTLAKETHPPATSSRPRKSYEQRKEEYAQARLRILGSSERKKEPP